MRILQINSVYACGSTGKIAKQIHDRCKHCGHECLTAYRYTEDKQQPTDTLGISDYLDCHIHNRIAQYTMLHGVFSRIKTTKFLKKIEAYSPDIIHLHNLHGNYVNLSLLFKYLKYSKIPVVWTLHDCWSMTGGCAHFLLSKCDKWKNGCGKCKNIGRAILDNTAKMHALKKRLFTQIPNLHIVAPSQWMASIVKESFFKHIACHVINNGIDLDIFRPRFSNFRDRYEIGNKFIILGVAHAWGFGKGLDIFESISSLLPPQFQLVIVGGNIPEERKINKIIYMNQAGSQEELAEIYSSADIFLNPTREDNFPTVNIEALACGTPVMTTDVGGSAEMIDNTCGEIFNILEPENIVNRIKEISILPKFSAEKCRERSLRYNYKTAIDKYMHLYQELSIH